MKRWEACRVSRQALAERVTEWTRQWKEEGFQEGRQEGLQEGLERGREQGLKRGMETGLEKGREETLERLRGALFQELEARFGPLSERVRDQAGALHSIEEMVQLIARVATSPSLEALGLEGPGSSMNRG